MVRPVLVCRSIWGLVAPPPVYSKDSLSISPDGDFESSVLLCILNLGHPGRVHAPLCEGPADCPVSGGSPWIA